MFPLPVYNGNTRSRKMGPPRSFTQGQSNQPSFLLDLVGSPTIVPGRGGVTGTFTRNTIATVVGSNGLWQEVAANTPRFGYDPVTLVAQGLLIEPAATDLLTARADARDMTTANWTLGATLTRARTQLGADGVANKATLLTGGAVAATNTITTTITAAASLRTYSVLIKRVSGSSAVYLTQDNFATSTNIGPLLNSSTYTLVQIAQSQLNAVIGIAVAGLADSVAVDWNQFSAGDLTGLINSRIPDTITTRNADVLTYATTGWLNAAAGTLYAEWKSPATILAGGSFIAALNDGTNNNSIRLFSATSVNAEVSIVTGGVFQASINANVITASATAKAVGIYQVNDVAGFANNASLGTDTTTPNGIPTVTTLEIGSQALANHLGSYVRKVAYYQIRMVNESAKALTL